MKNLTKAILLSTLFSAGFVQAAEPTDVTKINTQDFQNVAHAYLNESLMLVATNDVKQDASSLLAQISINAKANDKELIANNSLIAE
ncbi:hypothetical protein [Thalassotalea atypica]|uniref:hypothetical protein n=1 Tax=Thalassotalea atypica TaxID=2054316 RepID=UPI002572F785|nr:hypothetical protein [Thalassotalea atypica]